MLRIAILGVLLLGASACITVTPPTQTKPESASTTVPAKSDLAPTPDVRQAIEATVSARGTIEVAVEATAQAVTRRNEPSVTPRPAESGTPAPANPPAAQLAPQVVVNVGAPAPGTGASAPSSGQQSIAPDPPARLPAEFWTVCVWCDNGSYDPRPEAERVAGQVHAAGFPAAILWSSDYQAGSGAVRST